MAKRAAFLFSPGSAVSAAVNIGGVSAIRLTTGPTWTPASLKIEFVPGYNAAAGVTAVDADGAPVIIPNLGPQQSVVLPPEASGGSFMRLVRMDPSGNPLPAPGSQMIVATLAGDLSLPWTFVSQEIFGAPRTGGHEMIYLLRDDFLTAEAAPLTSPRTAEPGPGTWQVVQDVDDDWLVSDSKLVRNQLTVWDQSRLILSDSVGSPITLSPRAGLAMRITDIDRYSVVGFSPTNEAGYIQTSFGGFGAYNQEIYNENVNLWAAGDGLVMVARSTGGYLFTVDGQLLWVTHIGDGTPVYAVVAQASVGLPTADKITVARLPGSPSDPVPGNGYEVFAARDLDVVYSNASVLATDGNLYIDAPPDATISFGIDAMPGLYLRVYLFGENTYAPFAEIEFEPDGDIKAFENITGWVNKSTAVAAYSVGDAVDIERNNDVVTVKINGVQVLTYDAASTGLTPQLILSWGDTTGAISNLTVRTLDGAYTYPWQGPELVENGGFEAWTGDNPDGWLISAENEGNYITESGGACRLVSDGTYIAATQLVLEDGKHYLLEFDVLALEGVFGWEGFTSDGPLAIADTGHYSWNIVANTTSFKFKRYSGPVDVVIDNISIREVNPNASPNNPGPGPATDVLPGPVSPGDTFTHEADGRIEFDLDALPSGDSIRLFLRHSDDQNTWSLRIFVSGAISLERLVSSVWSRLALATDGTLSGGEHIVVVADGETIKAYYDNTLAWTYAGAVNFKTETSGKAATLGTGAPISNLVTYPVDYAASPNTYGASEVLKALTKMATPSRPGSTLLFAPDDLVATYDYVDTVHLEWTDNNAYETGYVVERSSDGGATWDVIDTLPAGTESYDDVVGA